MVLVNNGMEAMREKGGKHKRGSPEEKKIAVQKCRKEKKKRRESEGGILRPVGRVAQGEGGGEAGKQPKRRTMQTPRKKKRNVRDTRLENMTVNKKVG